MGTVNNDLRCRSGDGQCNCKRHVTGRTCSGCEEGFFGLFEFNYTCKGELTITEVTCLSKCDNLKAMRMGFTPMINSERYIVFNFVINTPSIVEVCCL